MTIKWKLYKPELAKPLHVCQMIPFDRKGNVLVMHRSPNIRSAANVWSFPSGMHDIGETARLTCHRELKEEYSLVAQEIYPIGLYENIAGDPDPDSEQFHWVISLFGVLVEDVSKAVNNEPDKHDIMRTDVRLNDLLEVRSFLDKFTFHKSFETFFQASGFELITRLKERAGLS